MATVKNGENSTIQFIKEQIDGAQGPNYFSAGFDAKKLVKGVRLSEQIQAIVGGAYMDHFPLYQNQPWRKWRSN